MSAQDYPITFGYGATDDTYYGPAAEGKPTYIGPYHRGDDRAMPNSTPVIVNGVQIGLSGDGNGRYGEHLHIGKFVNGKDVNPNGQGFSLEGVTVYDICTTYSADPVNAQYVRITDASGALWVFLHLSQVTVAAGQQLKGGTMAFNYNGTPTPKEKAVHYQKRMYRDATPAELANEDCWGKVLDDNVSELGKRLEAAEAGYTQVTEPLFRKEP